MKEKEKKVIQIFNMTPDERKCWDQRLKHFTDKGAKESKGLYKELRSKARHLSQVKWQGSKLNDIMLLLFTIATTSTNQFLMELQDPQANIEVFNPSKIKEFEAKRWQQRYDGFNKSDVEEDIAFMKQVKKYAKDHFEENGTYKLEQYQLWLFIVSYVQTGFWADDVLGRHRNVRKVMKHANNN